MGRAITEWEQNHGKSASEEARKRAEQRLEEKQAIKEPTIKEIYDMADQIHRQYRENGIANIKESFDKMNELIEAHDASEKPRVWQKKQIVQIAKEITIKVEFFTSFFAKDRTAKYMLNRAIDALETYK